MHLVQVFLLLQLLDFLTTVLAMQFGGRELNPLIRHFMDVGAVTGLVVAKVAVIGIASFVLWLQRRRVVLIANYFYAGLIVWNLVVLLSLSAAVKNV